MTTLPKDRTQFSLGDAASIVKTFKECNEEPNAWEEVLNSNGVVISERYKGNQKEKELDNLKEALQEIAKTEQLVSNQDLHSILTFSNTMNHLGISGKRSTLPKNKKSAYQFPTAYCP
jgi:hypothetical protein